MSEVTLEAAEENLDEVLRFVEDALENTGCSLEDQRQIAIAVEEVFINIVSYAYKPGRGDATLCLDVSQDPAEVTITFIDHGVPFDPLAKEDPDINLPVKQRKIGDLGIFVVKNLMDDVFYEYRNGQNILTMKKKTAAS